MGDATSIDFLAGRGEEARLAFHIAGAAWDDGRLATPGSSRRATTPYSGLPPMGSGDRGSLDPVTAILLHIGVQLGLHPNDEAEAQRHEAVMRAVEQLRVSLVDEPAQGASIARAWVAEVEPLLGSGRFLSGGITVADLRLFSASSYLQRAGGELRAALEASEALEAHRASVATHERVATWLSRDR